MRTFPIVCLVTAALACGGCFQSTTLIKVKGDGSGTIDQTIAMTGQALAQLRMFAALGNKDGKQPDLFTEEQARQAAAAMGSGVRFVSATPIHSADSEGQAYVLAFDDLTQLHVDQEKGPPPPGGLGSNQPPAPDPSKQIRFGFERLPSGNAVVKVMFPPFKMPSTSEMTGIRPAAQGQTTPEQMAMIKQMLAGARLSIAIEPAGMIVRTTSPYVEGRRVILLDMELDRLFETPETMAQLNRATTLEQARAALKDIPGLKVNVDPVITIEFTPAR